MANRIRDLRKEQSMSQEELSKRLGVSRSTISLYEQSKVDIPNSKLSLLSAIFNVSTDYLLGIASVRDDIKSQNTDLKMVLQSYIYDIENATASNTYDGKPIDAVTKSILLQSLKNSIELIESMKRK